MDAVRIKRLVENVPTVSLTYLRDMDQTFLIDRVQSARAWSLIARWLDAAEAACGTE